MTIYLAQRLIKITLSTAFNIKKCYWWVYKQIYYINIGTVQRSVGCTVKRHGTKYLQRLLLCINICKKKSN